MIANIASFVFDHNLCGYAAAACQFGLIFFGMPRQILKLWETKDSHSFEFSKFLFAWLACVAYLPHGLFETNSISVWAPQVPAIIFGFIILIQIKMYQKPQTAVETVALAPAAK